MSGFLPNKNIENALFFIMKTIHAIKYTTIFFIKYIISNFQCDDSTILSIFKKTMHIYIKAFPKMYFQTINGRLSKHD